jgi:multiple sugar transport system ATP-binding protein
MAQITLENLQKHFDKTPVLQDISLTIEDGEFLVLVGPSGCGKSTLLRILAGLEDPTHGNLLMDSKDITEVPPKDRDMAMVFQSYALYPHMSVYDNMAFGLKMRNTPKAQIERRVKEAAESLQLTELLQRKPKQLSGGQRQRVALGRAMVRQPKVFLMDEPLSNLDAKLRQHMRGEIAQLQRRLNTTTVYVTHDQTEAMTLGHRLVVLSQGIIQQIGSPQTVYTQPANRFVAGFIGQIQGSPVLPMPKSVWIGFRPEHFSLCDSEKIDLGTNAGLLKGEIILVERLGNDQMVYLQRLSQGVSESPAAWESLMVRLEAKHNFTIGQTLCLKPHWSQAMLFCTQTQSRLN